MPTHCMTPTARDAARFHRTVARMRRVNMQLCSNWVERLCEQLEAEWHESEAARLEAELTEHEATRAALIARGAELDDRFELLASASGLAYARVAL